MLPEDSPNTLPSAASPAPGRECSHQLPGASARYWIVAIAGMGLACLLAPLLLPTHLLPSNHPSTTSALNQWGLAFKMYANDSAGHRWPTLADNGRIWAPDLSALFPEYLMNPDLLVASEHPDAEHIRATLRAVLEGPKPDYDTASGLMALSFAYLGHAVRDEAGFQALVQARKQGITGGEVKNVPMPGGTGMIFPLREGIERFLITDINGPAAPRIADSVPVLVEIWRWKRPHNSEAFPGALVLFLDGSVKHVPLGTFPVVPSVMDALCGIAP